MKEYLASTQEVTSIAQLPKGHRERNELRAKSLNISLNKKRLICKNFTHSFYQKVLKEYLWQDTVIQVSKLYLAENHKYRVPCEDLAP